MTRLLKVWLMVFPVLGLYTPVQSQHVAGTIRGKDTHRPVESAYVTLHHLPDSLIVDFARTNVSGLFLFNYVRELGKTYFLEVSHISYHTTFIGLPAELNLSKPIEIQLLPGQLVLNEVQVTARVPVRERGDSTRYKVDAFRNGSERSIEDVLRKMPNVRVEDNGDIYFKNKRVEKVLLDGDDLVGNAYQLATRSINPAVLNEVQAVEHYSENKLLRQIQQSETTILNFTVKDERKTMLFGMLDAGIGSQRYDGVGNLFSYSKHVKAFSVLSANNIGTKRLDLSDANASVLTDDRSTDEFLINPFTRTAQPFTRNLNTTLENFNREQVGTFNTAIEPVKKLKVTANLTLFRDLVQSGRFQSYQVVGDVPFSYQQADTLRQRPTLVHMRVQAMYDLSSNTSLTYKGTVGTKSIQLDQTTQFATGGMVSRFPQQFNNQIQDSRHNLELTRKLNPANALVLDFQATNTRLTEEFDARLNPLLATTIFGDSSIAASSFAQVINQRNQLFTGQFKWLYGTKTRKFEQQFGYSKNSFGSDLGQFSDSARSNGSTLALSRQSIYSRSAAKFIWRTVEVSGHLQLNHVTAIIDQITQNRNLVQANLTTLLRLGSLSRFVLSYDRQANPVANSYLINQTVVTNFRSAQRGYRGLLFDNREQLSLSYLFTDVALRKMTLLATVFASRSNNFWNLADYLLLPDYSIYQLINTPSVHSHGATVLMDKLIYPLSGNIRLDISLLRNQLPQVVNGKPRETIIYTPSIKAKYISVFESPFNMEVGGTYQHTALTVLQNEQSIRQSFTNSTAYTNLFYRQKKYQIGATVEANRIQRNNYVFVKANANYQLSSKLSLRLEAMNLLNQSVYRQVAITPTTYSEGIYPLLGRMVLLCARFSF